MKTSKPIYSKYLIPILISLFLTGCSITGIYLASPKSRYLPQVAVWLPFWDWERTTASLWKNKDVINEVMPYWYDVTSTGTLVPAQGIPEMIQAGKLNLDYAKFVKEAHHAGIKVIPLLSNEFNGNLVHQILANDTLRNLHIRSIVALVEQHNYDGIDIDYEGMVAADRELYPAFLQEVATQLHRKNKTLSVCVHAKTSEPGGWDAVIAQDYAAIGKQVDTVRIMAYDFHYASGDPGAISPLDWTNRVMHFAVTKIPAYKISIGIGIYGINWAASTSGQRSQNKSVKDEEAMYLDAIALAKQYQAPIQFDEPGQEFWFTYTDASTGIPRTVWFENHLGFRSRWELAKHERVGSVSLWRIGGEDPELWQYLRADRALLFQPINPNYPKGRSQTQFGIDIIFSH